MAKTIFKLKLPLYLKNRITIYRVDSIPYIYVKFSIRVLINYSSEDQLTDLPLLKMKKNLTKLTAKFFLNRTSNIYLFLYTHFHQ
jgi:hypothetical protein